MRGRVVGGCLALAVVLVLAGCGAGQESARQPVASAAPRATALLSATPRPTDSPEPQPTASSTPQPTASSTLQPTALPSPTPLPTTEPTPRVDEDLEVAIGAPLESVWTETAPEMDGRVEAAWDAAPALAAGLHYGLHGQEPAGSVELRSLYDAERVYFLARWAAAEPEGGADLWYNLATVHWRLVDSGQVSGAATGSQGLACTVGCHTATASGAGQLIGIRAETIPPGLDEDLPAGGGWADGTWTLEWSRPRVSPSPYDQDLSDPARGYRFFVKLFLGLEGQPDPVSDVHELSLQQ
jgi:hypothetical protein